MKARNCGAPAEVKLRRRLQYCGTCKTIGKLYGQRSRLLLNNDTVFLAELLTALSGDDRDLRDWAPSYRSYNCMSLPAATGEIPVALQFAAAATMVLADFKITDHIYDGQGRRWKMARRLFRRAIAKATTALGTWGFPVDELGRCWDQQIDRECVAATPAAPEWRDLLLYYGGPTAAATGLFFQQGAMIACQGRGAARMRSLGKNFGLLVFVLDALEDYDKDAKTRTFNPLRLAFPSLPGGLGDQSRRQTISLIHDIRLEIESELEALPIPRDRSAFFISRLRANVSNRVRLTLPVVGALNRGCTHHATSLSIRDRFRQAITLGRRLTDRHVAQECESWASRAAAPVVFAYTAAMALLFPDAVSTLGSARESFGMPFNIILVGGLARSWPRLALRPMLNSSPPSGPTVTVGPPEGTEEQDADEAEKARRRAAQPQRPPKGDGDGCCSCCCDADCCCDCGDCCDCCGSCDCS